MLLIPHPKASRSPAPWPPTCHKDEGPGLPGNPFPLRKGLSSAGLRCGELLASGICGFIPTPDLIVPLWPEAVRGPMVSPSQFSWAFKGFLITDGMTASRAAGS